MARLEAIVKGLYYPTPERVVGMICDLLQFTGEGASLLDPCAGEGRAAAILAARLGVVAHGIELQQDRAAKATAILSWCRHGSYHQLRALGPDGKPLRMPQDYEPEVPGTAPFGVLFLNPPYDEGTDEHGDKLRQEIEFLRATTPFVAAGGLLVFVPPRKILAMESFREHIRRYYRDVRAYEFPSPEVDAFDQVVVLARRVSRGAYAYGDVTALDKLVPLDQAEPYAITVPVVRTTVALVGAPPESYCPAADAGAWAAQQWQALTGEASATGDAPLVAPRPGHQAMLLAAGALNGLELVGSLAANDPQGELFSRPRMLVKGGSKKTVVEIKGKDETTHRERISSYLSVLDLRTGDIETWNVDEDQARTAGWFEAYGDDLARGILAAHAPQFTDVSAYDFSRLRAPGILPGRTEPEILDVQREAAAAVVHRWRGHKEAILCGEMGTGKTTMGVCAAELSRAKKVVIVCPTHLTRKWAREAETITGRKGVALVAKKLTDVDAFFDGDATYLVLSKETAKLGSRWAPAAPRARRIVTQEITTGPHWDRRTKMVQSRREGFACPHCGEFFFRLEDKEQQKCPNTKCASPLWQFVPITAKGTKRWPLAAYIHDRYARRYHLIVDEAHQHSKGETDQARAVHQLISGARKVLMMTGTLYGGRASSIFHLLYRMDPLFRRTYKQTDCATFVEHHGLFETVTPVESSTSTYGYRKGSTGGRIREIPGMSPAMIPMLLPYTVFVKLRDLRLELPPYEEQVLLVQPDPKVLAAATAFQSALKGVLRQNPQVLGAYLQACLGYPDRPDQAEAIYAATDEDGNGGELLAEAPAIGAPEDLWPKDTALIELVKDEHSKGRKTLVFFAQTTRRDARPRVRAALESAGLRVVVLESSVAPEKREQWMRDRCDEGFDVMLTNGRLVETGLDMLFAATIVQYGTEFSIATLRQSWRRSWRLGQTQPVRVVCMAYAGTMQATATDLIARKMRAAELVDGDEAGGLAQHDVGGGNFLLELAQEALAA